MSSGSAHGPNEGQAPCLQSIQRGKGMLVCYTLSPRSLFVGACHFLPIHAWLCTCSQRSLFEDYPCVENTIYISFLDWHVYQDARPFQSRRQGSILCVCNMFRLLDGFNEFRAGFGPLDMLISARLLMPNIHV